MFADRAEIGGDQELMAVLEAGRQRAAGLIVGTVEENTVSEEKKPSRKGRKQSRINSLYSLPLLT